MDGLFSHPHLQFESVEKRQFLKGNLELLNVFNRTTLGRSVHSRSPVEELGWEGSHLLKAALNHGRTGVCTACSSLIRHSTGADGSPGCTCSREGPWDLARNPLSSKH